MTVIRQNTSRAKMTARERQLRSQLTQIFSSQAFTKGSLLYRRRTCGVPTCRCARGEGHPALCLVIREEGKQRQIFIPPPLHETVREWVGRYQKVKTLQEELGRLYWKKLQKREV